MPSNSIQRGPSGDEPDQAMISKTSSTPKEPPKPQKYDYSKYSYLISHINSPRLVNGEPAPEPDPRNYDKEIGMILAVYERYRQVEKLGLEVKKQRVMDYFNKLKPSDFADAVGYL